MISRSSSSSSSKAARGRFLDLGGELRMRWARSARLRCTVGLADTSESLESASNLDAFAFFLAARLKGLAAPGPDSIFFLRGLLAVFLVTLALAALTALGLLMSFLMPLVTAGSTDDAA